VASVPVSSSLLVVVVAVSTAGVEVAVPASRLREEACVVVADAHWAEAPAAAEEARSWWVRVRADYFRAGPIPGGCWAESQAACFPAARDDCSAQQRVADYLADSAEDGWIPRLADDSPAADYLVGSLPGDDCSVVPVDYSVGSLPGDGCSVVPADYLVGSLPGDGCSVVPVGYSVGSLPEDDCWVEPCLAVRGDRQAGSPQEDDWVVPADCWAVRGDCSAGCWHRGARLARADFPDDSKVDFRERQERVVPVAQHYLDLQADCWADC
jgi:hypothetical protein